MPNQIFIDGDENQIQLRVQGDADQTLPLQTWEDSDGAVEPPLARMTADGRFELGSLDMSTQDALIEANSDVDTNLFPSKPLQGIQTRGIIRHIGSAISGAIAWMVAELELRESGGVSGIHTALRSKISNYNTGDATEAELRAGDFEAIVKEDTDGALTGKATGLRSAVTNEPNADLNEAIGVEIALINAGSLDTAYGLRIHDMPPSATETYAIHTSDGPVHLGDYLELLTPDAVPGQPAANNVRVYPRSDGKLYAKDSSNQEYDLTGDMRKSVYDIDADGIVDNAEALQGHPASDFALTSHNHDSVYAPVTHNHDSAYASLAHEHDDRYFRENEHISTFTGGVGEPVKTGVDGKLAASLLPAFGIGDMSKNIYDTDNDGVVDNAEALQGHPASDFATVSHNHDSVYAPVTHNHDSAYASLAHDHDSRYFTEIEHISASSGGSDAGKPVKTDLSGKLDVSLLPTDSMTKTIYDTNGNGVVDNAENAALLENHPSSYFAIDGHDHDERYFKEDEFVAMGGTLNAPVKTNNTSGRLDVSLLPSDSMTKSTYDTDDDGIVDNAAKLGGQTPSYYAIAEDYYQKTDFVATGGTLNAPVKTDNMSGRLDVSLLPSDSMTKTMYDPDGDGRVSLAVDADTVDGYHATAFVTNALFGANTILQAGADSIPTALPLAVGTIPGRMANGDIAALTASDVWDILGLAAVCQGRLSLSNTLPAPVPDITGATTVYFLPYKGNRISLYDGTRWKLHPIPDAGISLSLSGLAANTIYDIWVYDNSGTLTLEALAWSDSSAGSSARATGLTRQNGIYVKSGATTRRYLGSLRITNTAGQSEDSVTQRLVWNYYNRVARQLGVSNASSHTYGLTPWQHWDAGNTPPQDTRVTLVIGVVEERLGIILNAQSLPSVDNQGTRVGIGFNTADANNLFNEIRNTSAQRHSMGVSQMVGLPAGYNYLQIVESGASGTAPTFERVILSGWVMG